MEVIENVFEFNYKTCLLCQGDKYKWFSNIVCKKEKLNNTLHKNLVTDTIVFTLKNKFFLVIQEFIQIKAAKSHLQTPRGNQLHVALYLPKVFLFILRNIMGWYHGTKL